MPEHDPSTITWRIHLTASQEDVFRFLTTDEGRGRFWAESAREKDGAVHFRFPNGQALTGRVIEERFPSRYVLEYIGGNIVAIDIEEDGTGGTDLTLTDMGVPEEKRAEVSAGWVSVLMNLKAAAEFGVDLRNHDGSRTWDARYVDS